MTGVFRKLNLKNQSRILVLNAPDSFEPELASLEDVAVLRNLSGIKTIDFVLAFTVQKAQIDELAPLIVAKAPGDAIVWFAYPKSSSKKYRCDFNRDSGWEALGRVGFEPVRQVSIDEDWSALRFRRVEFIKTLTRSWSMTEAGQSRQVKTKPSDPS